MNFKNMFNPHFTNTDESGLRTEVDGHGVSYDSNMGGDEPSGKGGMSDTYFKDIAKWKKTTEAKRKAHWSYRPTKTIKI